MLSTDSIRCLRALCCSVLAVAPIAGCIDQMYGLGPGCRAHKQGVLVKRVTIADTVRGTDLAEFEFYAWKHTWPASGCRADRRDSTWIDVKVTNRSALPVSFDYELTTDVSCYPDNGSTPRLDPGTTWAASICDYSWPHAGSHDFTVTVTVSNIAYGMAGK